MDSYYFPPSQVRPNVLLDKKSHDRIQTWLSEQHEYTGYPPPEEESIASLRSSSAVDVLSNDRSPIEENLGHFPKYKSEERIQSPSHFESDEQKRIASLKRYNSPDCIRRRYFSPRSDPNLNTVGKQAALLPTRSVSYKHLWPAAGNDAVPDHLNRTFYQGGKGNTFPRRNKFTVQRSVRPELTATDTPAQDMGQNMEKYQQQQRVLLNPYASVNSMNKMNTRETEHFDSYEHIHVTRKDEPVLAGRTFVLNGISLQNKQDIDSITSRDKNTSSVIANLSRHSPPLPVVVTEIPVSSSKTAKAVENMSLGSTQTDLSPPQPNAQASTLKPQTSSTFHMRVASAPATTDSNNLERDLYWRSKKAKRKVSHEVRKVKAFSWPKRAVLLEQTDKKFLDSVTRRIVDRAENNSPPRVTEKREDTNNNYTHYEDENDNSDAASDQSDIPPERPPLPPEHMYSKREGGSHSSVGRTHSQRSSRHTASHSQVSEEKIFDKILHEQNEQNGDMFSLSDAKSVASEQQHYHSPSCELSKRVSMSLKDLIRIHEKEIARVSGAFSTRTLDKIEEKSTNDTFGRDENSKREHTKWKRHTTIGLLGDYLQDSVDDVDAVNDSGNVSNPEHTSESEQLSAEVSSMSPKSSVSPTTRKFNITISSLSLIHI